ncbi:MAG TPA: homogentisate 1,2-dioxygenase, partial [Firmicutes bacterium]|nr:homogentisate 1,2-dioxygenase [Bacillota bacterium]
MPFYQSRGRLPRKRHTVLRRDDGSLVYEELIGNESFAGGSSLLYRLRRPTQVLRTERVRELAWQPAEDRT